MAQAFRFAMDRRMQNKGYRLVEMLVVLSILSMLTLLFAFSYRSLKENTTYWSQSIYERLLQAQTTAMTQKRKVFVDFQGNRMSIDGASFKAIDRLRLSSI